MARGTTPNPNNINPMSNPTHPRLANVTPQDKNHTVKPNTHRKTNKHPIAIFRVLLIRDKGRTIKTVSNKPHDAMGNNFLYRERDSTVILPFIDFTSLREGRSPKYLSPFA